MLVSNLMLVSPVSQARACAGRMLRRPFKVAKFVFLCLFIVFLSSGFNLEGNMDIDMETQAAQPAEDEAWLLAVEAKKHAIEQLPYVKAVTFSYGETANLCKVFASVWCCWENSRRTFKQVAVSCDLDTKPTYLEALHALQSPREGRRETRRRRPSARSKGFGQTCGTARRRMLGPTCRRRERI